MFYIRVATRELKIASCIGKNQLDKQDLTSISPVVHKRKTSVAPKKSEDEESKLEILSLAPFTPNPKIVFDNVVIGTDQTRKLLIKNPTGQKIDLFVKKTVSEDMNLVLSWSEAQIEKNNELLLEMIWRPTTEVACRQSFSLSDGKRINRDVAVTFKSVGPKQLKAAGARSKSKQPKSSVKLPLSRKKISPTKKLKPQGKSPIMYPTIKKRSPVKYYSPPQKCQNPQFVYTITKDYSSPKKEQSYVYQKPMSQETLNFLNELSSKENKENMSPSYQHLLRNASASFTSPSNATFLMEIQNKERRETYFLNQKSERRDTYTFPIDKINFTENKDSIINSAHTFTIESVESSPNLSDSLETPSKTLVLREKNNHGDTTPSLGSLLNMDTMNKHKYTSTFEDRLKNLENFVFSPTISPCTNTTPKLFLPIVCSTDSKLSSANNSNENNGILPTELFPQNNQSSQLNETNETYTRINTSSNTYTRDNSSFETYIVENTSTRTYVKDNSMDDLEYLEGSPVSSRLHDNPSFKQKSSELSTILEATRNGVDMRKAYNLSSIAEESSLFSESTLRIGCKRKKSDVSSHPLKREKISPKPNKSWSKKGGAACRIAKSTSGLKLDKFMSPLQKNNVATPLVTFKETNTKSVIIQNPFLYANIIDPFMTSDIYCDDEWINQQELQFIKWLNALLAPPTELNAKTEVDVALVWQECKKKEVCNAPTKETLSFNFHTTNKLDCLRKQAQILFRSKDVSDVLQKVCIVVESGKLLIREDKDLHLNLKLKSDIVSLILSYNPLWLRIGLETIYNEIIPLKSNSDTRGLASFILERFLKDPNLLKKHKTPYSPKYSSDLKKFLLKKFLILVYFLDKAKNAKLIPHDPCLFCKNATEKESKLILTHFARETLSAVGDITKYLKCLGYLVTHVQSYIHEFDYAVTNLGVDLRDGVRLTKVMEIIQMRGDLTGKLRVPAISRLQKVHNMQLVFKSLQEYGYEIQYDICEKDIVDGHREKTLSFLWQIIYKFEAPLMVKSATIIQTWFRCFPIKLKRCKLRKIYEQRANAVKKIQEWYKRQKLSKFYFTLAELLQNFIQERQQEVAATKIQNFFRMAICRKKYLTQVNVVVKLQTYGRGWLIRHNYRRRIFAATIIQKILRGYMCRKKYVKLRDAAIFIQRKVRANQEMRKRRLAYKNLKFATINIQRRYRANLVARNNRQHFIVLKAAVIKIQSLYKMYAQRKQFLQLLNYTKMIQTRYRAQVAMKEERSKYLALKNAALIIQQRLRAHLKMNEYRTKYLTQKNAAIKIQSFYRMHKGRKYFLRVRTAVRVIQLKYRANARMRVQRIKYMATLNATVFIQKMFRSYLTTKNCREEFLKLKIASVKIQSSYRRYKCQKQFLEIQKATKVLQERYRALKAMREIHLEYQALKKSVVFVQRRFRANQLKNKAVLRYTQIRQSTITVQSFYRMFVARKRFLQLKDSALIIQQIYRALRAMREQRSAYQKLRNAAVVLQRRWRAKKLCLQQHQSYLELKKAAVVIQQRYKANKQMQIDRHRYYEVRSSAMKIQVWYRSILCMRVCRTHYLCVKKAVLVIEKRYLALKLMQVHNINYKKLKKSVIFVQQCYRAKIQMRIERKQFLHLKFAAVVIQRWYRTKKLQSSYKKLKEATLFVQAKFRANTAMKSQRRNFVLQKTAAITIQQWYRATIKMKNCRSYYKSLKLAVKNTEERYKAKKIMESVRSYYKNLRNSCLIIQRRYRAVLIMRELRKQYLELQKAVIVIQRRYRAWKAAKIESEHYQKLKNAVICIQRHYRALRSMHRVREEWIALKQSTISIQRRYRAQKQMVNARNNYYRLKKSAVVIQRWYRAQKLMTKYKNEYQMLRRVVMFVQQKFRANILARQERVRFLKLKKSVLIVQQQFRAQILMKSIKADYIRFKEVTVMVQRTFRATVLMRSAREEFVLLRKLTIIIQRRYRATRVMIKQRLNYKALKEAVMLIQRKFRANKLTEMHRSTYLQLRHAAVVIQRRYRAKKLMECHVENYSRLRWATLTIQRRYRAQAAMKKEMLRYQQLKHVTLIIQRKLRATILCRTRRRWFLKLKKSASIIQACYRANLLMRKERKMFLAKYKAAITIQRFSRGYLVRKKYSSLLTPEAIEARRLLKLQTTAAIKIQARWRGYSVRKSNIPVTVALRRMRQENMSEPRSSVPGRTLAQRCEMAMLCMTSENSSLLMVIRALEDLDFITRHCRDSCIRLSLILPNQLYIIISSAARSLPEMSACNMAAFILINFCKYPLTKKNSWNPDYIDAVINVLLNWCDKEAPLFSTLCTLLWLFCYEEKWKKVILSLPNITQRFRKIQTLVHRKQNMVIKSRNINNTTVFGPVGNMKLPSRNANWGLDYNRPNTFTNAVFALTSLMHILDI